MINAAVLHALGSVPRFEQFAEPTAGTDEAVVNVRAAALKPVDRQMAAGSHFASPRELPCVCGSDGAGILDDGTRVFFGGARRPFGTMAERTVVPRAFCFPIPENLDDLTAAAVANPGVSAWLSLTHRAKLAPGEVVLVLGATGVTGKLAVQIARLLGAARVIAAGRNRQALAALLERGADAVIQIDRPEGELRAAFAHEAGETGFQVIIDYLWGRPTESFLAAITRPELELANSEMRLVQAGESAGPTISLPAAALRSTALTILGTAGIPSHDLLTAAFQQVMTRAAAGQIRVDTDQAPLADIEEAWTRPDTGGRRLVIVPL
ncbi:MAG TPA: zinc-binding alcohol dehydrogenase family protein [Terriglobia bacterium]|nr:zinc-binding alcohol dehydrogenase family protein [Terriglobia bacterium]